MQIQYISFISWNARHIFNRMEMIDWYIGKYDEYDQSECIDTSVAKIVVAKSTWPEFACLE